MIRNFWKIRLSHDDFSNINTVINGSKNQTLRQIITLALFLCILKNLIIGSQFRNKKLLVVIQVGPSGNFIRQAFLVYFLLNAFDSLIFLHPSVFTGIFITE